jgi:hypothetical protein
MLAGGDEANNPGLTLLLTNVCRVVADMMRLFAAVLFATMQLTSYGKLDAGEEAVKQQI